LSGLESEEESTNRTLYMNAEKVKTLELVDDKNDTLVEKNSNVTEKAKITN